MVPAGKILLLSDRIGTGINIAGSRAEYMVAYAEATQLMPDGLSYDQAAPIFSIGYTYIVIRVC
jgi:D-arabinose 1-dehydrogenase-like Zn-dependent alcohol dehydrogenase